MEGFDQAVFLKFLAALLALVNPLYGVPIFLSLTEGYSPAERRWTALIVMVTVTVTALLAVLVGEEILAVFGISIPAFRVAGGLIVFSIGMAMLNADDPPAGDDKAATEGKARGRSIAVVPLAIPLTIGPGAIVTSIVFAHELSDYSELVTLVPAVFAVSILLGVSLLFAVPIIKFLGPTVLSVMTRVMAIILAAVAIEMILTGIGDAFDERYPGLIGAPSAGQ